MTPAQEPGGVRAQLRNLYANAGVVLKNSSREIAAWHKAAREALERGKLRILVVLDVPVDLTGSGTAVTNLVKELDRDGQEVRLNAT